MQLLILLHSIQNAGKYTVFYDYAGHVNTFGIKIYKGNWDTEKYPVFECKYYLEEKLVGFWKNNLETTYDELISLIKMKTI